MSYENFIPLIAISPILVGMVARSIWRYRRIRREIQRSLQDGPRSSP